MSDPVSHYVYRRVGGETTQRRGFTLLEITIVLLIMVGLLAVAWPRMSAVSRRSELREAAIDVKSLLNHARDQSIRNGQETRFSYQSGSNQYQVGTTTPQPDETITVGADDRVVGEPRDAESPPDSRSKAGSLGSPTVFHVPESEGSPPPSETRSVTFFPDGRSTDSEIQIALADGTLRIKLSVRGLTGGVTIHPVEKIPSQDAQSQNRED